MVQAKAAMPQDINARTRIVTPRGTRTNAREAAFKSIKLALFMHRLPGSIKVLFT